MYLSGYSDTHTHAPDQCSTWTTKLVGIWYNIGLFMAALWNREGHYIFALWFLSSSFFPRL